MLTKSLILGALAATGAVAQMPLAGAHALQARILDDLDSTPSCSSAKDGLLSIYAQLPTPAAVLDEAELPTGVCETPSFTGETAKAWSSYTSAAIAVLASNTAAIASAFSACPDLEGRMPNIPDCAATAAPSGGGAAATTTPAPTATSGAKTGSGTPAEATGTESGSASSSSTPDKNAAPRVGAIVGTVLGAAGLVAVVAAL